MSNLSFVVTNLTSKSQDHNLLIDRINLQAKKGEIIVIMGPNGAGKSSFFKTLCKHHNIQVKSGQ
jgi:Fe-S cluster assembly ATPase SufC